MHSAASYIDKARKCLDSVKQRTLSDQERCQLTIDLAALMLAASRRATTSSEKRIQAQLARMMRDPFGKAFTTAVTDQAFRSTDPKRCADQLIYLLKKFGNPHFLNFKKKMELRVFKWFGNGFATTLVPLVKKQIRRETARVIVPGEPEEFAQHLRQRRSEGVRINLNHLGEAILGEEEAEKRLQTYLDDLQKPEVEYISVKISTICSQINLLAWEQTLSLLTERLGRLYRAAQTNSFVRADGKSYPKFVNLDMEEYRDLHFTVEAFRRVLELPEFFTHSAGIVLQSYLPDSFSIQQELTKWARQRVSMGGAPIKIRIVKGANLSMEKVEASLRSWPQAPFQLKADTDANFKKMVSYGMIPENAIATHLGIGSHNLFDIAYALLLRAELGVEAFVSLEMLEGMAESMRRVVQALSHDMLLYCPVARQDEFQYAVAYLIRRLDENTAPENFLRHVFDLRPGTLEWEQQSDKFVKSYLASHHVSTAPHRTQNRFFTPIEPPACAPFSNESDTDWSLPQNRHWAETLLERWAQQKPAEISLANTKDVEKAIATALQAAKTWNISSISERSALLAKVAQGLRIHRADLIGAMVSNTKKTVSESDIEVSEAIDFAEYYRRNAEEWHLLEDIQWHPKGTILVAPPWNFPCSIPAGGILAALAAGNCVIFKPAPEAILVGWELVQVFWNAGISREVLQFLPCEDDPAGTLLVKDPRISAVVLTGSTATAKLMSQLRPGLDLIAETGGKNAMIITSMSDRDLAIKDLIQSAFGHSGQKCSACSLAICEAEVYDDPHFRQQLRDAAASLHVDTQWNLATRVNPLIQAPNPVLLRGLTQLEEGEEWLLTPQQHASIPNLWSPGIKLGVRPGSFTHQNELFGPVLGLMRADHLQHAIELANGTPYGLTSGLHSLDEREQEYWTEHIIAGNCYINRGMTGAIVQRQPFGGCKESSFGRGAKAGGPNYVMQLMNPEQIAMPAHLIHRMNRKLQQVTSFLENSSNSQADLDAWKTSLGSYLFFWERYFNQKQDPSSVLGQDNFFYYVPHQQIVLRINDRDSLFDTLRVIAAANICNASLEISGEAAVLNKFNLPRFASLVIESEAELIHRKPERIRLLSKPNQAFQLALAEASVHTIYAPVIGNGRIELLNYLREVSLSIDYHRYGYLGLREEEERGLKPPTKCSSCSCK